jgi:hypothetical protein
MLDIIDSADSTDCPVPELMAATLESHNELGEAITSLWVAHANAKIASRVTNEELRALRAKLGEQLSEMKKLLVRPGCDGRWSGFLRERQIPRATADRLVARHLRSLNPDPNRISEAVSEPTEEEIQELFTSLWPKLRRTLRSRDSLALFVELLTSRYESGEATDREALVLTPPTATICLAPSDEGSFDEPEFGAPALVALADEQII